MSISAISMIILLVVCITCITGFGITIALAQVSTNIQETNGSESVPEFEFRDELAGVSVYGLPSFWNLGEQCLDTYQCVVDLSNGWNSNSSLKISTTSSKNESWSWINSQEITVVPGTTYLLTTHMKVNDLTRASHLILQGYDESSNGWKQLTHCPSATNGPSEWRPYRCTVTIPADMTKILLHLNTGWSSTEGEEAVTWFDDISISNSSRPVVFDSSLKTELVATNLINPSKMEFIGLNDFLVLDRIKGVVERFVNGVRTSPSLLNLNVTVQEGLLGIAVDDSIPNKTHSSVSPYVYLYYSESEREDCICQGTGNKLVRYDLVNNNTRLTNPKLLLDLPIGQSPNGTAHNGGALEIGPDGNLYLAVGDLYSIVETGYRVIDGVKLNGTAGNYSFNQATNYANGSQPDGRAGILRITKEGLPVSQNGTLGQDGFLDKYFAYGIRNSFGMNFDPVSGKLWMTENGPDVGDEINMVEPGFNSGWPLIAGSNFISNDTLYYNATLPNELFDFGGRGHYSSPEFEWKTFQVGPTAIAFMASDALGEVYKNTVFVGDVLGNLYHFVLNENRTGFELHEDLQDRIANTTQEMEGVRIGEGFGTVTDLNVGPDGNLYVLSLFPGESKLYKISRDK